MKSIVIYYSYGGNTRRIAKIVADVREGLNIRFNEDKQITSDEEVISWAKQILV